MGRSVESFVYSVNGEKRYYRLHKPLSELPSGSVFLGIAKEPVFKPQKKSNNRKASKVFIPNQRCSYCLIPLNKDIFTRDHFIPKYKGGNILIPCCYECNQDKSSYMPTTWLFILEDRLMFSVNPLRITKTRKQIFNLKILINNLP